jgi:zinc/manganese transport system substrate-binding protein
VVLGWSRALVAGGGALALGACGGSAGDSTPVPSLAIATTSIWADITSNVLCGEPVATLIPAGADPHTFEPSLRDRALIDRPAFVIANGGGLEGPVSVMLESADETKGTFVYDMTDFVELVDDDPHIWQDPTLVASTTDGIEATGLGFGRDPDLVSVCADEYRAELEALDAEIAALIESIPPDNRVMVTSHDSLGYFARRYGLEVVGTVIPSNTTLAETNAADLAALSEVIAARHVPAVFTEELASTNDADALAARLGVPVVPLVTDALTSEPGTDTYIGMMRSNAQAIARALSP